jgi:hypothetical protein
LSIVSLSCSDVQYADIPDGTSFHGVPRYYRNALVALQRAVSSDWVPAKVDFGIHFGDIVDGFQARDGQVGVKHQHGNVLAAVMLMRWSDADVSPRGAW